MTVSRRQVLLLGGLGALGAGALSFPSREVEAKSASRLSSAEMPKPFQSAFVQPPVLQQDRVGVDPADGGPVNYYTLTQKAAMASILPRLKTPILGYNGIFPGPTISLDQGTKAVLRVRNQLPATHPNDGHVLATSTHLHGSASLPQYDGYASDITEPGQKKDYHYPNFQPARTLWYHDHGVHYTAQNAYSGLASQYHLHDPMERALLPQGEFDVALYVVGHDVRGQRVPVVRRPLAFRAVGRRHPGQRPAVAGDEGQEADLPVPLPERLAVPVLPAHLSTGADVHGGHRRRPDAQVADTSAKWRHGSAERYEVLIDFSQVQDRAADRAAEPVQPEQPGLRQHQQDHGLRRRRRARSTPNDPTWSTIPTTAGLRATR